MRTLGEVLDSIDDLDPDLMIYAPSSRPLSAGSQVTVALEPDDGSVPPAANGMEYLLEVPTAQEAIQVWSDWRAGRLPTTAERVAAVVHYADYDAYLPVDDD